MEFKLTIDITDKLAAALASLAASLVRAPLPAAQEPAVECAQNAAECAECNPPVVTPPEPETVCSEAPESQESATVTDEANSEADAEPVQAEQPEVAKAPADKPKKKKAQKKPVEAPERVPETAPAVTPPEPKKACTEAQECATEPAQEEQPEAAKAQDDPMCGMTVVDAVKALVDEIQAKGIDMGQVNARVRAKANEIGLAYASAACLIKAIGYTEARKIALNEK